VRVQLVPQKEIAEPEVLVYWSSVEPKSSALPDGARLLGKLEPAIFYTLPEESHDGGILVIYSAARNVVLDSTSFGGRT
jgi:hypothetical protein